MAVRPELPTFACLEPLEARLLLATTVFYDGFEDAFPGTPPNNWVVGNDPGTTTKAKWGDNYALAAAGDWSAFCADNGDANNGDARETYDNKLHTTMERQNVSLAGFTTAALTFQYWLNSEENTVNPADPYDYFTVNVKDQSGVWHNKVFFDSGDDSALGWQTKTVDLSAYAGQNNLTIQFRFDSDTSYVPPAPSGVWVDEISLIGNPLPDLSGYDCYAPASAFWGQTISLQGQVDNTGSVGTGAFTQQFYLSADTTWGNADDVLLGSYPHAALAASELGPDFNLSVTLPGAPPNAAFQPSGTYYIGMKTDALGAVAESDETNNSPGGPLWQWYDWDDIAIGYDTHVDLTVYKITDTSGTPGSANPGQDKSTFNSGETVRITLKAANAGALRNVQLGLVLYGPDNTTVVYDSHDPLKTPSGHVEDLVPAAPLAGASTGYYSFDWTLPSAAAPGAYDIVGAIRDSANWNFVLDNTAPGAGTVGSGPEAVVRDRIWRYEAAPANRTADDTSEYMMGKVQVNVVLPASTGVNSTEAWTIQEITDIKRELAEGVAWWTTTLPDAHLSFQFDFTYADHPISTTLEPITLTSDNDDLWMADMLTVLAPGTTGAVDDRLRTYADQTRRASGSDWAYTVFVVDDTQDADHMFADEWFAYADLGGPVAVMTYHNDGWGVDNMGMVFAHETGHIFYALDEYADSGSLYTDYSGYLNIQNTNAIDGNPHPATVVPSLMGESDRQATAYDGHTSSLTSLQMVGYRDTDADGILDILDTAPSISTTVLAANSVTGAIRVQTTGAIVPLSNNNPLGWGHDISLNTVSAIQYHLDGGPWLDVPAQDGAYDEPQETAILDLAGLANGAHHLYFRTKSSVGGWSADGNVSTVSDVPFTVNHPATEQWTGGASGQWDDPANWALGFVPGADTVAVFDGPVTRQPVLGQNLSVKGIDIRSAGWTVDVNGHTLVLGSGGLSLPGGAVPTATVDLKDGNLVVDYAGGASPLAQINDWVRHGANFNPALGEMFWNGTGITSSAAAADPDGYSHQLLAVGVRQAVDAGDYHMNPMTSVDGVAVNGTSVVVKYTWMGDADLDGKVTIDDYYALDYYYTYGVSVPGTTGWWTGDFNGDGRMDIDDYYLMDIGYTYQGAPLGVAADPATTALAPAATDPSAIATFAAPSILDQLLAAGGVLALGAEPATSSATGAVSAALPEVSPDLMEVRLPAAVPSAAATGGVLCLSAGPVSEPLSIVCLTLL